MPKKLYVDISYLNKIAQQTGFKTEMLEKVYRLIHLMHAIESLPKINKTLSLKGGTATNFIYYKIPRLSVDIDLNYVGAVDKEKMIKQRKIIEKILLKQFKIAGYRIKVLHSYIITRYLLKYKNVFGGADQIKIEINYLDRVPTTKIIRRKFKHFFDVESFEVNTYPIEELLAGKICALIQREQPRDLFDVYMLEKEKINLPLQRKLLVFYYSKVGDFRNIKVSEICEGIDEEKVKRYLKPLLSKKEDFNLSKAKKEVLEFISKLVRLTKTEKEFVKELYDNRSFKPGRLFGKIKINPELKEHPSIKLVLRKLEKR